MCGWSGHTFPGRAAVKSVTHESEPRGRPPPARLLAVQRAFCYDPGMLLDHATASAPASLSPGALRDALSARERRDLDLDRFAPASVLIPVLAFDGPLRVVLTVRTAHVEHHKNQISFPGGHQEDGESDAEAALRETHEEVGIEPGAVEMLGRLDDVYTISDYRVTPFVGWIERPVTMSPNPRETETILEVPIADLLNPKQHRHDDAQWHGRPIRMHFYYWNSHIIWGVTGMILAQFLDVCREVLR